MRRSCTVIDADFYGRLDLAWNDGPDSSSRLSDWLDPLGIGVQRLGGRDFASGTLAVPTASARTLFLIALLIAVFGWRVLAVNG